MTLKGRINGIGLRPSRATGNQAQNSGHHSLTLKEAVLVSAFHVSCCMLWRRRSEFRLGRCADALVLGFIPKQQFSPSCACAGGAVGLAFSPCSLRFGKLMAGERVTHPSHRDLLGVGARGGDPPRFSGAWMCLPRLAVGVCRLICVPPATGEACIPVVICVSMARRCRRQTLAQVSYWAA